MSFRRRLSTPSCVNLFPELAPHHNQITSGWSSRDGALFVCREGAEWATLSGQLSD